MTIDEKTREELGIQVRNVWLVWAREQPNPKSHWLRPWEQLTKPEKDVNRRIGEALYNLGRQSHYGNNT
jgi:hypothetical protein